MRINLSSLYRRFCRKLTMDQKVCLRDELLYLGEGIEILEELQVLADKYKFGSIKELETILEKGEIKK